MAIGFYDYDIYLKPTKLLLNLEAMKIASYYNNLGKAVVLESDLKKAKEYEEFYIFRNTLSKNTSLKKEVLAEFDQHMHYYGLAYSEGVYIPMDLEFEKQTPYIQLYSPYLRDKIKSGQLTFVKLEKILNSHFLRLRAGDYELDLTKLARKEVVYIYDYEIEEVSDWLEKLKYCREELMSKNKNLKMQIVNGFKLTSFENVKKISEIHGIASRDIHLFSSDTYKEFKEKFDSIAPWVSSRDGIKYYFGHDVNAASNIECIRNLCLSINKYLYTKGILKACEFIVSDNCEVSQINKLQKDFQYWTVVRLGDQTLKDYFLARNKKTFNEYYDIIARTAYRKQFDSLCSKTKNEIKKAGWYYHE